MSLLVDDFFAVVLDPDVWLVADPHQDISDLHGDTISVFHLTCTDLHLDLLPFAVDATKSRQHSTGAESPDRATYGAVRFVDGRDDQDLGADACNLQRTISIGTHDAVARQAVGQIVSRLIHGDLAATGVDIVHDHGDGGGYDEIQRGAQDASRVVFHRCSKLGWGFGGSSVKIQFYLS